MVRVKVLSLASLAWFFGQVLWYSYGNEIYFFSSSYPAASGPVCSAEILHSRKAFSPESPTWTLGLESAASGEQDAQTDRQTERLTDSHVLLKQYAQLGVGGVGWKSMIKPPYVYIPMSYFLHHSGVSILWDIICQNIWISLAAVNCCFFWIVESVSVIFG